MTTQPSPAPAPKQHAAFFKQSGWLMIASIAGGGLTYGVHFLAKSIPEAQYSIFGTLLVLTAVLPTMPLQMIFAAQTAAALATNRERQLAGMIRLSFLSLLAVWLLAAVAVFIFQDQIVAGWKLGSAWPLWVTMLTLLAALWAPMFTGVMQGRQDFFMMGWAAILGGVGRVGVAAGLVLALGCGAAGMMAGALLGMSLLAGIGIWRSRDLWSQAGEKFEGRSLLRSVVPLMFGFGAFQFMFTSDTMYAKYFFSGEAMAPYVAAGTLSRALLWLVLPLATVMFPKLVHSNAKAEQTNLLKIVLLGTGALAIFGGLGLWLVGPVVVKLVYKTGYVAATTALLPWYAAAMVPLALANVLVNDLMARGRFRVVPAIVVVAVAYGFTLPWILSHYPPKLETVLQTLGVFNCLLLAVCAWGAFAKAPPPAVGGR